MRVRRVVSGGQTGVDRAALDAALACGIAIGGWCPRGRKAEDGSVPHRYPLVETPSPDYGERTLWNVRDSDGTLVLALGEIGGGTLSTTKAAARFGRPLLVVDLAREPAVELAIAFIERERIGILNVAGPRESRHPGIYGQAYEVMRRVLDPEEGSETAVATPRPKGGPDSAGA